MRTKIDFEFSSVEPRWWPARRAPRVSIPVRYRPWLFDPVSLTQSVIRVCAECFRVEPITQSWARPMRSEASMLEMRPGLYALVREVYLVCGATAWVYARTVIPQRTLSGRARRLARLKTRSLGSLLYSDSSARRRQMQFARLAPGDKLFMLASRSLARPPQELWGRRAVFTIEDKPLLVNEVFLPAIGAFSA